MLTPLQPFRFTNWKETFFLWQDLVECTVMARRRHRPQGPNDRRAECFLRLGDPGSRDGLGEASLPWTQCRVTAPR